MTPRENSRVHSSDLVGAGVDLTRIRISKTPGLCLDSRMGKDLQLVLSCFVLFFKKGKIKDIA